MTAGNQTLLNRMVDELRTFCTDTGLPHESADELARHVNRDWQRAYLADFCRRWEEADSAEARKFITFEEFRATGHDTDDVGAYSDIDEDDGKPGRVYLEHLYINRESDGKWLLIIGNQEWFGEPLETTERHLYEYARGEGFCDRTQ